MDSLAGIPNLIEGGAAGLIIIVVVMFLRFLTEERKTRNIEHNSMMSFIQVQRAENNQAVTTLANALSAGMTSIATELKYLREQESLHHQFTNDAVGDMRALVQGRRKTDKV
jgi:hypothetical protein